MKRAQSFEQDFTVSHPFESQWLNPGGFRESKTPAPLRVFVIHIRLRRTRKLQCLAIIQDSPFTRNSFQDPCKARDSTMGFHGCLSGPTWREAKLGGLIND